MPFLTKSYTRLYFALKGSIILALMILLLDQLSTLLTTSPGNLIYHLAIVFSIAGAFQAAYYHWRSSQFPQVRRAMLGLTTLVLAQLALFIISGLAWQGIFDPAFVLPPLDRAITLFSLIWITWLWAFPETNRSADATTILLSILVLAGFTLDLVSWGSQIAVQPYNATVQNMLWQVFSILFAALAGLVLVIRRPSGWQNGLVLIGLVFLGHTLFLVFNDKTGSFSGTLRLIYLAAFPMLMTLPQRFPTPVVRSASATGQDTLVQERRRYSTDPKTFHALLGLAAELEATKINHAITRAIAQTMLADLCFLIYLTEDKKQLVIASGYDLIREENLEGASLSNSSVPMLANSLQRGRPLRMPESSTSPDLQGLSDLLGLDTPGNLLSTPILTGPKDPIGGILLLSPYSNRLWDAEDQAFLTTISTSLVPIIRRGKQLDDLERRSEEHEGSLAESNLQLQNIQKQRDVLKLQVQEFKEKLNKKGSQDEKLESLHTLQEESLLTIERLQQENEDLRQVTETIITSNESADSEYIEHELRSSLEVVARLQNALAKANMKVLTLEKGDPQERANEQAEVIASIAQELRQPMSSIVGYTDLLLGESVGILGALQRKFVERTKSSIERIGKLVDDMIQVTTLEMGLTDLKPEAIDLNEIIDNAMSYTSNQIREKNISLNLDLPKKMEPIQSDREALQQIVIHLLQNAGSATPVDGTVTLLVRTKKEDKRDYILIQVSDTGGGIPLDDIQRVFTRMYRAENVLIQGVGDTGVGLSIAKALTEAQHGRIWVESTPNVGATFSVLLPIAPSEDKGE